VLLNAKRPSNIHWEDDVHLLFNAKWPSNIHWEDE
jgi:hypothetical protein